VLEQQIAAAKTSLQGQAAFRASLSPERQIEYDASPNKDQYMDDYRKADEMKKAQEGTYNSLREFGMPDAKARSVASAPPHIAGAVFAEMLRARNEGSKNQWHVYDGNNGLIITGNGIDSNSIKTTKVPDWEPKEKKDEEVKEYNTIIDNAKARVELPFRGPMGAINMKNLGKTEQEQEQALRGMVLKEATDDAKRLGRGYLFDPQERLAKLINENKIDTTGQAVAVLESHGVDPKQSEAKAREVINRVTAAKAKKEALARAAQEKQKELERQWGEYAPPAPAAPTPPASRRR
jgi:hypothetical protein